MIRDGMGNEYPDLPTAVRAALAYSRRSHSRMLALRDLLNLQHDLEAILASVETEGAA